MPHRLGGVDPSRLERSGGRQPDSIRFGESAPGIERAEVHLSSFAFEPHRHDTYAIGVTTAGVQTFRYRGTRRVCLPGQLHVLHPDEVHDGGAGTDDGFGYRILYIAPELVSDAVPGHALPFIADPVHEPARTVGSIRLVLTEMLTDINEPISDLRRVEIAAAVADALWSLASHHRPQRAGVDIATVRLVREYLAAHAREQTSAAALEQLTGTDRFTIARHFRRAFGTSPDRYRTLRRLALVRAAIEDGQPLARASAEAGFADQSHMTRQFKRAYGLTPRRWMALTSTTA